VAEDYGLSAAPVLVIDLRLIFGRNRDHLISIVPIIRKYLPFSLYDLRHGSEEASSEAACPIAWIDPVWQHLRRKRGSSYPRMDLT
jgi:hypothetical protein